jgi:hypothetical protein
MSTDTWTVDVPITKRDDERRQVFGWLSVAKTAAGEMVVDLHGDIIPVEELEKAVYAYMGKSRRMKDMHERDAQDDGAPIGVLIESMMFTVEKMKAMGIPPGTVPEGWWIGYQVDDNETWAKIKDGTYKGFSIGGSAKRERVA